jgi:NADH dehydrogenase
MLEINRRRRMIVALPQALARLIARVSGFVSRVSRGLIAGPLTVDQVKQLAHENVVTPGARGLAELGVSPTPMQAVLESYLYAYRPAGQYTEIQESALRVRT